MLLVLIEAVSRTFTIAVVVFVAMLLVDYVNVLTRGSLSGIMKKGRGLQYVSAAFLGSTPGCVGAFMTVSFYLHGLITFGATLGCMIATSGDEAFVMLASFPGYALLLFGIQFLLGIGIGWLVDLAGPFAGAHAGEECKVEILHSEDECCGFEARRIWRQLKGMSLERGLLIIGFAAAAIAAAAGILEEGWEGTMTTVLAAIGILIVATTPDHYLLSHVVGHIVKKHLGRIILWTFFALLIVGIGLRYWNLEAFVKNHRMLVLLMAALVGVIPQSGPHLVFVSMFAQGMVPFSVLLTNSIVQEGHALLPLMSCSIRDALLVKGIKFGLALAIGFLLHALGL
jgi:hypothetical protein